jgi:hypothetical protein
MSALVVISRKVSIMGMHDDYGRGVDNVGLLTELEKDAMETTVTLWNQFCKIVEDGVSRNSDLREVQFHIHGLQRMIMSQAAARAYPGDYRLLGATVGNQSVDKA